MGVKFSTCGQNKFRTCTQEGNPRRRITVTLLYVFELSIHGSAGKQGGGNGGVTPLIPEGVTKRCRLSWLTKSTLVYESRCGGDGVGGGGGFGVSANEYSCAHGVQINFGDPTPYLTCGPCTPTFFLQASGQIFKDDVNGFPCISDIFFMDI